MRECLKLSGPGFCLAFTGPTPGRTPNMASSWILTREEALP